MAVVAGIYNKCEPEYVGCVLDTYERNGYSDSDWYAVCWDEEKQAVVEVNYDTTRAGGGGWADIDITTENLRKAYRYYYRRERQWFDWVGNPAQAKSITKGDMAVVIKGRKVPQGTVGKVFWVGIVTNHYTYRSEKRVGIEVDGERLFLPMEYVENADWKSRLISGKHRKRKIQQLAVNRLPIHRRRFFED